MSLVMRLIWAVAVGVAVGLVCILGATLLGSLKVPPASAVADFLAAYAWVIAVLAAIIVFAKGGGININFGGPPSSPA